MGNASKTKFIQIHPWKLASWGVPRAALRGAPDSSVTIRTNGRGGWSLIAADPTVCAGGTVDVDPIGGVCTNAGV
jgi:hypothetical protein